MKDLKLSPRLNTVAELAAGGKIITDVGTDHGHIPVWLALRGLSASVTATDIKRDPLQRAMNSAREYGVYNRIRFVLCDGLDFTGAQDSDTVIIAGMGGETIISILERAKWTQSGVRLILQPQSKLDELCAWLSKEGYELTSAVLTEDAGRKYVVLTVNGTGVPRAPVFAEEVLLMARDPLLDDWLDWRIRILKRSRDGITQARECAGSAEITEALRRLEHAKEETESWLR